jgi:hypothetical protein
MKKIAKCRKFECDELPFMGGLCKQHHEEDNLKKTKEKMPSPYCMKTGLMACFL